MIYPTAVCARKQEKSSQITSEKHVTCTSNISAKQQLAIVTRTQSMSSLHREYCAIHRPIEWNAVGIAFHPWLCDKAWCSIHELIECKAGVAFIESVLQLGMMFYTWVVSQIRPQSSCANSIEKFSNSFQVNRTLIEWCCLNSAVAK